MRASIETAAMIIALVVVVSACPTTVDTGSKHLDIGCSSDADCLSNDACVNGTCTTPIGIGNSGEGEGSIGGEGEGSIGGEGEGSIGGEGEGASSGEGEGASSGEGEGEGAAGPTSGALFVTAGPE